MRIFRVLILGLLICFSLSAQLFGATVGKIQGQVIDQETGQPLPGCNVIVEGTTMGSATDIEGFYTIINVPPGLYNVKASMMGYAVVTQTNVRVNINRTTTVNFTLGVESIEGEEVVITAKRPLQDPDVTAKRVVMNEAEIRSAPVQNLTEALTMQSGVIAIENQSYGIPGFAERGIEQIHVRGGRAGEIGYVLDGMYIRNPLYGGIGSGTRLNKYAASEVVFETGVFNAEYGDAMSSIVNYVTKTGDFEKYEGFFRYSTSEIGGPLVNQDNFLWSSNLRGLKDYALSVGGPIPGLKNKVSFYVSAQSTQERNRVLNFDDNTWTEGPIPGNHPWNEKANYLPPYNPNDEDDHSDPLDTFSGWRAMGHEQIYDVFAKLAWRITPSMNLTYSNWIVNTDLKVFSNSGESILFQYYPRGKHYTLMNTDKQTLELRHQLNEKTFYTLRLSRFWQRARYRVKNYDSDGDGYQDWLETRLESDPYNADPNTEGAIPVDSDGDGYPDRIEENLKIMRGDRDDFLSEGAANDPNEYPDPELYPMGNEWLEPWQYNGWFGVAPYYSYLREGSGRYFHHSYVDTYEARFDLTSQLNRHHQLQFGLSGRYFDMLFDDTQLPWLEEPYTDYYHKFPYEFSAYMQDKIEYDYMTINLGLRMDAYNFQTQVWSDLNDPQSPLVDTETKYNLSPRIGISHIITDRSTFTFGYGIFHQNPTYRNIYTNSDLNLTTPRPILGNPTLQAQKNTAYEFGIKNQLTEEWVVSLVGWTKEYTGLTATEVVPAFPFTYTIAKDIDYGTARGLDVTVQKVNIFSNWAGRMTYTYSKAMANRGDPWEGYRNTDTPETMPKREIVMPYDRRHQLGLFIGYRVPKTGGIPVFGYNLFNHTNWDLTYNAMSGSPYTPTIEGIPQETYSARMPWIQQMNLTILKVFKVNDLQFRMGLEVRNLFDMKNVIDVYPETGKPDDPGRRSNNRVANFQNSDTVYDVPYFYGERRSIQFTTEIEF